MVLPKKEVLDELTLPERTSPNAFGDYHHHHRHRHRRRRHRRRHRRHPQITIIITTQPCTNIEKEREEGKKELSSFALRSFLLLLPLEGEEEGVGGGEVASGGTVACDVGLQVGNGHPEGGRELLGDSGQPKRQRDDDHNEEVETDQRQDGGYFHQPHHFWWCEKKIKRFVWSRFQATSIVCIN